MLKSWVNDNGKPISFSVILRDTGITNKDGLFWYSGTFFGKKNEAYQGVSFYSTEQYPLDKLFTLTGHLRLSERLVKDKNKVYLGYTFIFPKQTK